MAPSCWFRWLFSLLSLTTLQTELTTVWSRCRFIERAHPSQRAIFLNSRFLKCPTEQYQWDATSPINTGFGNHHRGLLATICPLVRMGNSLQIQLARFKGAHDLRPEIHPFTSSDTADCINKHKAHRVCDQLAKERIAWYGGTSQMGSIRNSKRYTCTPMSEIRPRLCRICIASCIPHTKVTFLSGMRSFAAGANCWWRQFDQNICKFQGHSLCHENAIHRHLTLHQHCRGVVFVPRKMMKLELNDQNWWVRSSTKASTPWMRHTQTQKWSNSTEHTASCKPWTNKKHKSTSWSGKQTLAGSGFPLWLQVNTRK